MSLTFVTTQSYSSGATNITAMHTFALVCVPPEESKCDGTMMLAGGKASEGHGVKLGSWRGRFRGGKEAVVGTARVGSPLPG